MDEININTIEWDGLEYSHKEHGPDWYWAVILITIVICGITLWMGSYLFAIFIIIGSASLILFNIKHPETIHYTIETSGLTMGKDKYEWQNIKGFDIKKKEEGSKLLIELNKYLLPVYTISIPEDLIPEIKESLLKVTQRLELEESKSLQFMEKLGF